MPRFSTPLFRFQVFTLTATRHHLRQKVNISTLPFATHATPPPPPLPLPASMPPTSPPRHRNCRRLFDTHAPTHARFALLPFAATLRLLLSPSPCLHLRRAVLYLARCQRHQKPTSPSSLPPARSPRPQKSSLLTSFVDTYGPRCVSPSISPFPSSLTSSCPTFSPVLDTSRPRALRHPSSSPFTSTPHPSP